MKKTQKEIYEEAFKIHSEYVEYMGDNICRNDGDVLKFCKWVLKREREAVKKYKNTTCNHAWNYTGNHCLKCGENK